MLHFPLFSDGKKKSKYEHLPPILTHDTDSNAHTNRRTLEAPAAIALFLLLAQAIRHVGKCELMKTRCSRAQEAGTNPYTHTQVPNKSWNGGSQRHRRVLITASWNLKCLCTEDTGQLFISVEDRAAGSTGDSKERLLKASGKASQAYWGVFSGHLGHGWILPGWDGDLVAWGGVSERTRWTFLALTFWRGHSDSQYISQHLQHMAANSCKAFHKSRVLT